MIEIKNLSKSFGKKKVIDNFSLSLKKGERIALISFSGSGKTTLLRIISGLEKKYGGECKVSGKVSYMFQENRLFDYSTVLENVLSVTDDKEKALKILSDMELKDSLNLYPSDLSGGMKRRVALARALSADSDILLLDEAFTGLDEDLKKRIISRLLPYTEDKTVILVTHSKEDAELMRCKTLTLEKGFI